MSTTVWKRDASPRGSLAEHQNAVVYLVLGLVALSAVVKLLLIWS